MTAAARAREGKALVTDGPFAAKERLGNYYLVEATDPRGARAKAPQIAATHRGCAEARPIRKFA